MTPEKVNAFLAANPNAFSEENMGQVRDLLLNLPAEKEAALSSVSLKNPTVTLILAFLGPWDLLYLGQIGMFFLKWLTCCGCYIWWIIGMVKAKANTQEFNYNKLVAAVG